MGDDSVGAIVVIFDGAAVGDVGAPVGLDVGVSVGLSDSRVTKRHCPVLTKKFEQQRVPAISSPGLAQNLLMLDFVLPPVIMYPFSQGVWVHMGR